MAIDDETSSARKNAQVDVDAYCKALMEVWDESEATLSAKRKGRMIELLSHFGVDDRDSIPFEAFEQVMSMRQLHGASMAATWRLRCGFWASPGCCLGVTWLSHGMVVAWLLHGCYCLSR